MVNHFIKARYRRRSRNRASYAQEIVNAENNPDEANSSTKPDMVSRISSVLRRRYFKHIWDEMTEKQKENGVEKRKVIKTMRLSNATYSEKKIRKRKKGFRVKCNRVIFKGRNHLCCTTIVKIPGAVGVKKTKKKRFRRRKKSLLKKTKKSKKDSVT